MQRPHFNTPKYHKKIRTVLYVQRNIGLRDRERGEKNRNISSKLLFNICMIEIIR